MPPLAHGVVGPDLPVSIVDLAPVRSHLKQEAGRCDSVKGDHAVVRVPSEGERNRHAEILGAIVGRPDIVRACT